MADFPLDEDTEAATVRPLLQKSFDNRYKIGKCFPGGSGLVFILEDTIPRSPNSPPSLVVKVLRPSLAEHEKVVKEFEGEASKSENLRHPNLVKIDRTGFVTLPEKKVPFFSLPEASAPFLSGAETSATGASTMAGSR